MHDPAGVHVLQSAADLVEVFPNGLLWNQTALFFEMLQTKENNYYNHLFVPVLGSSQEYLI